MDPKREFTSQAEKFEHQKAGGEEFEQAMVGWLNASYPACHWYKIPGLWPYYDLRCDHCDKGRGRTVECYTDYYAQQTGNEFFERNKLHATTADYIVIANGYGVFWYRTFELLRDLRRLVNDPSCKWVKFKPEAGDGKRQAGITCWLKMWIGIGNMYMRGPRFWSIDLERPKNTDVLAWTPEPKPELNVTCSCKGCTHYAQRPVDNKPPGGAADTPP
jgi:hypothetical protein